jgi:bacterial/archaeal transporter family protein
MQDWFVPSLFSLFSFGFWGLFTKLAMDYIDFKSAMIYQSIGVIVIALIGLGMLNFKPAIVPKGIWFAVLTGLCYALGCLFYFIAASKGNIITVVTLTALYPLVTIILSYFIFSEPISVKKLFGIMLALSAIFLMS